jgi:hypothetical protein
VFWDRGADGLSGEPLGELVTMIDVAADRGLVILQEEGKNNTEHALPDRFAPFVVPVEIEHLAVESFGNSRIVIGVDPSNYGWQMVPQLVFDALAAGCVVIAPDHPGLRGLFHQTVVFTETRAEAESEIERLLQDEEEWTEISRRGRLGILHAHTYANRVATIASTLGFRLIPEPERGYVFSTRG